MRLMVGLTSAILGLALALTGCAKFDLWRRSDAAPPAESLRAGMPAPEIDGVDFEGRPFKLSDYRGKVVVVAFWASYCRPCINMIPYERSLAERYRDKPFALVGVNLDDSPEQGRQTIAAQGISWRCLQSGGWQHPVTQMWKINAIPALFVIDAKGIIRHANVHGPSLDRALDGLIADAEKKRD